MKLTNSQISIILKGVCHSMLAMVKPSLSEINKMLEEFGMELIIKPTSYSYRSFPCMNFTWYVSGSDTRPNGIGSGILEWCVCESDAYEVLAAMEKFSYFTDLKVGNTEWEQSTPFSTKNTEKDLNLWENYNPEIHYLEEGDIVNDGTTIYTVDYVFRDNCYNVKENAGTQFKSDILSIKKREKSTPQFGEFVLTFEEAIQYLKENPEGKVIYDTAKYGAYVQNSSHFGFFAWYDCDGLGNSKWYKDGDILMNGRYHSDKKWAIVS